MTTFIADSAFKQIPKPEQNAALRHGRKRSCLPRALLIEPVSDAGGVTEISRWREPPDPIPNEIRPGGGGGNARFPAPLPGRIAICCGSGGSRHRLISVHPRVCRRIRHSRENQSLICATRYSAIAFATAGKVTRRFLSNVFSTSARSMNSTSRKHFGTRSSFLCCAS